MYVNWSGEKNRYLDFFFIFFLNVSVQQTRVEKNLVWNLMGIHSET